MEDFTVPMLSDSGFNGSSHTTLLHHHKDHMLSAGNTPATPFIYEMTNKPEHTSVKSDYAAFTNCIQQSALLDHRAVEANVDGVSLSSLCDLKFPSPPSLSVSLNTDSNFKNLSLMSGMEANHVLVTKSATTNMDSHSSDINSDHGPSFTNLLFQRDVEPKVIQNCVQTQAHHYLTLKSTEPEGNFLQRPAATTLEPNSCESNLIGFAKNNHMQHVQGTAHRLSSNSNYIGENGAHLGSLEMNNIDCESSVNASIGNSISADNHITTTTTSTITATANKNSHSINNNNIINNTSSNNVPTRSTMHSIDDIAAGSCSAATGAVASVCNSNSNNNTNASISKIIQEEPNPNHQNLSNLSSDCDSQSSSEEEFVDLEISERGGYQDNTSSHSQQSASGGGGTSASNSAAVALLNGTGGSNSNVSGGGGYMSLLQPAVGAITSSGHHGVSGGVSGGTSASAGGPGEGIDFKHLFEELCPVCGDKVSGYHYGLLTCESCKGFFKRTVQNKKVYTCVAERSCHIDKTQRKRCPYCRFQKCLEVGMKLEAVRADRMRGGRNKFGPMYKRDRARKLQVMRQRQLALQALRTSIGSADMKPTPLSPGYQQAYPNMNIKQEIQIPQVSSLTQSPDSSPSPIAIALGQVNASTGVIAAPMNGNGSAGGGGGNNSHNNNNNTTSEVINRGATSNCHDATTGSLQNTVDSKLCFDSGTHPSSSADSVIEPLRVSPMIREFVQSIDDREWQTQLFALLQKQTYNQVEVDLFELMCKVLDQNLFSQVDWARNTVFFKDLKVDDQMKLLQHSWSDMLVLDHLHQRIHNGLPDETQLNNGQVFNLLGLGLLGVPQLADYFNELQNKLQDLKFDMGDYVCMKFLILLNPDVRGIINKKTVLEGHENVQAALLDYTLTCYPSVTDKFRRLLNILPDIHAMASRGEEHLYSKHCAGSAPTQTLLMEMLHAKRKV